MSRILVDVGNSSIKWCEGDPLDALRLGPIQRCDRDPEALAKTLVDHGLTGRPIWIASVAGQAFDARLRDVLEQDPQLLPTMVCQAEAVAAELGVINSYPDPGRMGVDRWLAMIGARHGCADAVAVIDAGTALTIDLVAASGEHLGGYIIPGTRLMEQALTRDTERVRFDDAPAASVAPGQSTAACVTSGIWAAALGAVELVCQRYPDHHRIITGGDSQALLDLGVAAEWRPNLVLEGLNVRAAAEA